MSALTFEILSTELTLALSEQSDTPPDTTARCNLGRDKVMVLVEYPLDSAQAEPTASQTLDWLEAHLRNQFDTTGLPEEAAELAETGEEVPVQLFLKHRSEPKPFTMRSFIWKVDDGFDDIFGQSSEPSPIASSQASPSQYASEAEGNTPIFRHPSDVATQSSAAHSDQNQTQPLYEEPPVKTSTVASSALSAADSPMSDLLAADGQTSEFQASELSEPVPSELDEEHLMLDLEPDLGLDLDSSVSGELDSGLSADLSADMAGTDLDFEHYLSVPASENAAFGSASNELPEDEPLDIPLEVEAEFVPVSSADSLDADPLDADSLDADSLDIEAEVSSASSSPVSSSPDLDDLAAGLTYPSATPSQRTVDTGAAFDADLAAGVSRPFAASSSELSLPGEAPTITSSELDLPTVDLPVASATDTNNPSGDFFTFAPVDAEAASTTAQAAASESLESLEALEDEAVVSQFIPALEDDLSVEFGLSPEDAPPAVYGTGLSDSSLRDTVPDRDIVPDTDSQVVAPQAGAPQAVDSQAADSQVADSQAAAPQAAGSSTDEDDLHLFDLPTADESLSDFDLPVDLPTASHPTQGSRTETIEDYLSTEELPSDDLSSDGVLLQGVSSEEPSPEAPDSIDADNLFEDPLMAEVDAASSSDDVAGPPSLDLSPLAYHILADESDDDASASSESGQSKFNQGDRTATYDLEDEESREVNEYASDGYASDDYEDDSTYYLEDEDEDFEEPLEDVALIDDGEVERQRDQWQQQSKGNPWVFVGALGLVVLGVLGFVFTRPCSFGARCDRIQTAQAQGDEAIGNLRLDASLESVNTSKAELERAIQSLKPIPVWSPHHDDAQAILPEYENQVEALELVTKAQGQAYQAAEESQNPPHSVSTWNGIAEGWLAATQSLEAVPADSPVRELADRKLLEYRSNRATILVRIDAESKAEVSLRQSQQAATKATNLTQNAGTLQDWEDALAAWESAVDNLSQIPQGTNAHGEAQQILPGYLKQLEEVRDRTEQERSASRELFQAKQLAADAQRAQSEDRWTVAAQNWKMALSQLQDIPQGTLSHSEAQALSGLYTSALNSAESNLQIALRFQPVEPEFFAACGTTTAQKCTYSVRGGNVRLDLFQGYDNIIDQSITPPDQRVIVPAPNDPYVAPSNQLLKSITLLSTQAQVPIELYDAKGAFLARYRPDLNGFVREQS